MISKDNIGQTEEKVFMITFADRSCVIDFKSERVSNHGLDYLSRTKGEREIEVYNSNCRNRSERLESP
jgi:hypothetical protein